MSGATRLSFPHESEPLVCLFSRRDGRFGKCLTLNPGPWQPARLHSYCYIEGLGHCWSGNNCCDSQCANQNPENIDASGYIVGFFEEAVAAPKSLLPPRGAGAQNL